MQLPGCLIIKMFFKEIGVQHICCFSPVVKYFAVKLTAMCSDGCNLDIEMDRQVDDRQ